MSRVRWRPGALTVLLSLAASCRAAAAAPPAADGGVIRGVVVDRTAPAHPVAGRVVRLQIIERGTTSERETRTDRAGVFVFAGLPLGGIRIFLVSARYEGVWYGGEDRMLLTETAPRRDVPLAVYEAGAPRAVLHGLLLFSVVDVVPGALRVTTVEQVRNATDRTVVATAAEPLVFPLPRDAVAATPLDGWRDPHVDAGQITDVRALAPGAAQVTYAYQVRPAGGRATVAWAAPYGAARIEILVADEHLRVAVGPLRAGGPITASGRRYTRWSGGPVPPGGTVTVGLDGVPAARDGWPGALAAALAVALAAGLTAASRRPAS